MIKHLLIHWKLSRTINAPLHGYFQKLSCFNCVRLFVGHSLTIYQRNACKYILNGRNISILFDHSKHKYDFIHSIRLYLTLLLLLNRQLIGFSEFPFSCQSQGLEYTDIQINFCCGGLRGQILVHFISL